MIMCLENRTIRTGRNGAVYTTPTLTTSPILEANMAKESLPNYYSKIKKRIRARVRKVRASGCWEWQGCRNPNGYGRISFRGSGEWAHRVAFEVFNGREPQGWVLHSCDNPPCVNPAHLREGTPKDNCADRDQRERSGWQKNPGTWALNRHFAVVGKRRLSDEQVTDLRRRYANGETAKALAKEFGVSFYHVPRIAHGKIYRLDVNGKEMPLFKPTAKMHNLFGRKRLDNDQI